MASVIQQTKRVFYRKDGNALAAVVHELPPTTDRLAILTPGYLDSKDYPHLVHLADSLAQQGYTAVRYDPSCTWESEGQIEDYTFDRQIEDIQTILESLLKEKNYSQILLGGHSRGGRVSLLYASVDSRVSGVLMIMSPTQLAHTVPEDKIAEWKRTGFRFSKRNVPGSTAEKEFHVPYSDFENTLRWDALKLIHKIHVPIFLVAGTLDTIAPVKEMQALFHSANQPKYFVTIENVGHDYRHNMSEINEVDSRIIDLLQKSGFAPTTMR